MKYSTVTRMAKFSFLCFFAANYPIAVMAQGKTETPKETTTAVPNNVPEVGGEGTTDGIDYPNKDSNAPMGTVRNYSEELNLMGYYTLNLRSLTVFDLNSEETFELKSGARFSFVKIDDKKNYWLKIDCSYIPFDNDPCNAGENLEGLGDNVSDGSTYTLPKENLPDGTYTLSRVLDHGILLVPFKIRFDDGSTTAQTTVGYYAGLRSDSVLYSGTVFGAAGMSIVPVLNDEGVENNATAFSFALGYTFSTKSNFQVSIVFGVDHLGGSAGEAWQYEDDPWASIALGYNFMTSF